MFSPSDLVKRVGVGGGLVPFFKSVCLYFLAASGAPGPGAAAAKCAPVLCLLAAVLLLPPRAPSAAPDHEQEKERRRYARLIAAGLALSALGDALLVWEQHFAAGMAAFSLAHVAYMCAFRAREPRRRAGVLLYLGAAVYCALVPPPPALAAAVPLYALLLVSMAWRALRSRPAAPPGGLRAAAAPAGALLFVLSDALLGYSLFRGPLPRRRLLVMSTYYLGQLGLALSALLPPPPPPPLSAAR